MSSNLQLFLRISTLGAEAASSGIKRVSTGLQGMGREVSTLSRQLNSFSTLSKAAFAYTGFNAAGFAKDAFKSNLDFHRDLLEMKQTGDMSAAQMASAKKHIMEASGKFLQTPQDMLEGLRAFTTAGEKYEFALAAVDESARAATAFFSRPVEIANMDVDLKQKMNLRADQLKQAHNMLLYHARSGRYETKAMSMDAPRTLNTMSGAGFTGIEGVNLMGALTQRLMRLAPTTQPSEVATYMEHFLAHLTQPHYVQGLAKAGIDIKKYMPGGKFGGVDAQGKAIGGDAAINDFLALLEKMREKKLTDPFEMGKAGFREMYTSKAAQQSLQDVGALREAMKEGIGAAKTDLVGAAFAEIKEADFGKMKAAEIVVDKLKLSDTATNATGGAASSLSGAAEFLDTHKIETSAVLAGGALIAGRLAYKKVFGGKGESGGVLGNMLGKAGGVQSVFVTNWPGTMLSPGEALRQKREQRGGVSGEVVGETAKGTGRGAMVKSGAVGALKWGAPITAAISAYSAWQISHDKELSDQQKKDEYKKLGGSTVGSIAGGVAGGAIGALFGGFGAVPGAMIGSALGGMAGEWLASPQKSVMDGYQASNEQMADKIVQGINDRPLQVNVSIGDQQLAEVINSVNARDSRRN